MFSPASCPCLMALRQPKLMRPTFFGLPANPAPPPAAYTFGALVRRKSSTRTPIPTITPLPARNPTEGTRSVAMTTREQGISTPPRGLRTPLPGPRQQSPALPRKVRAWRIQDRLVPGLPQDQVRQQRTQVRGLRFIRRDDDPRVGLRLPDRPRRGDPRGTAPRDQVLHRAPPFLAGGSRRILRLMPVGVPGRRLRVRGGVALGP